jgi:bifunctional DNA-binding transcriptional regulator/antitoxin component of YhaV-PrlF toxin-antitoxin module
VTLPETIRKAAKLAEDDLLEAEVTEDGVVILRPVITVDRSQAGFWQAERQAEEQEASSRLPPARRDLRKR